MFYSIVFLGRRHSEIIFAGLMPYDGIKLNDYSFEKIYNLIDFAKDFRNVSELVRKLFFDFIDANWENNLEYLKWAPVCSGSDSNRTTVPFFNISLGLRYRMVASIIDSFNKILVDCGQSTMTRECQQFCFIAFTTAEGFNTSVNTVTALFRKCFDWEASIFCDMFPIELSIKKMYVDIISPLPRLLQDKCEHYFVKRFNSLRIILMQALLAFVSGFKLSASTITKERTPSPTIIAHAISARQVWNNCDYEFKSKVKMYLEEKCALWWKFVDLFPDVIDTESADTLIYPIQEQENDEYYNANISDSNYSTELQNDTYNVYAADTIVNTSSVDNLTASVDNIVQDSIGTSVLTATIMCDGPVVNQDDQAVVDHFPKNPVENQLAGSIAPFDKTALVGTRSTIIRTIIELIHKPVVASTDIKCSFGNALLDNQNELRRDLERFYDPLGPLTYEIALYNGLVTKFIESFTAASNYHKIGAEMVPWKSHKGNIVDGIPEGKHNVYFFQVAHGKFT